MWEVHSVAKRLLYNFRITPTYVGSTKLGGGNDMAMWDHPHVCGKYLIYLQVIEMVVGSPPRMWEVLTLLFISDISFRITPTYVGSTITEEVQVIDSGDHPHVCGKYFSASAIGLPASGSPPRMWEVRTTQLIHLYYCRITPTYVGST